MRQEDRELLLADLCARLSHGVFCVGITYELDDDGERYIPVKVKDTLTEIHNYKLETASVRLGLISSCKLETVKPYLRPMSSMTEEEEKEISILLNYEFYIDDDYALVAEDNRHRIRLDLMQIYIDYLNAHHFDHHNLIERGLAIAVTEENDPYKE